MIKHFNPTLAGFSTGESSSDEPAAGLNVAVGGAIAAYVYSFITKIRLLLYHHNF